MHVPGKSAGTVEVRHRYFRGLAVGPDRKALNFALIFIGDSRQTVGENTSKKVRFPQKTLNLVGPNCYFAFFRDSYRLKIFSCSTRSVC